MSKEVHVAIARHAIPLRYHTRSVAVEDALYRELHPERVKELEQLYELWGKADKVFGINTDTDDHTLDIISRQAKAGVQLVANSLKQHGFRPDLTLTSPIFRAKETRRTMVSTLTDDDWVPGKADERIRPPARQISDEAKEKTRGMHQGAQIAQVLSEIPDSDNSVNHVLIIGHDVGPPLFMDALGVKEGPNFEGMEDPHFGVAHTAGGYLLKVAVDSWEDFKPRRHRKLDADGSHHYDFYANINPDNIEVIHRFSPSILFGRLTGKMADVIELDNADYFAEIVGGEVPRLNATHIAGRKEHIVKTLRDLSQFFEEHMGDESGVLAHIYKDRETLHDIVDGCFFIRALSNVREAHPESLSSALKERLQEIGDDEYVRQFTYNLEEYAELRVDGKMINLHPSKMMDTPSGREEKPDIPESFVEKLAQRRALGTDINPGKGDGRGT